MRLIYFWWNRVIQKVKIQLEWLYGNGVEWSDAWLLSLRSLALFTEV